MHPLPPSYATTRDALHRLAVYVISPAQRLVNDEIVMHPTPGGFSTFPFDGRVIGVAGDQLVIDGSAQPIGSLNQAAAAVGIQPDVGQADQFDVPAPGDLDEQLAVDAAAAAALASGTRSPATCWRSCARGAGPSDDPSPVRIWPEHFDIAVDSGDQDAGRRATYGASPGDRHHDEPYLYASPWAGRIDPFFGDPTFKGASVLYPQIADAADPRADGVAFYEKARELVLRSPTG